MDIIVYRQFGKRASETYEFLKRKLRESAYGDYVKCNDAYMLISVKDINISVCYGDVNRLAGRRADFWSADSSNGKILLAMQASKRNGKELNGYYSVYSTVLKHLTHNKEKENMDDSTKNKKDYIVSCCKGLAVINGYYVELSEDGLGMVCAQFLNPRNNVSKTVYLHPEHIEDVHKAVNNAIVYVTSKLEAAVDKHPKVRPYTNTLPGIKKVIFNDPATIVIWKDGSKTIVKAQDEAFDPEKGLAMAISKKALGNNGRYFNEFKKWLPEKKETK